MEKFVVFPKTLLITKNYSLHLVFLRNEFQNIVKLGHLKKIYNWRLKLIFSAADVVISRQPFVMYENNIKLAVCLYKRQTHGQFEKCLKLP